MSTASLAIDSVQLFLGTRLDWSQTSFGWSCATLTARLCILTARQCNLTVQAVFPLSLLFAFRITEIKIHLEMFRAFGVLLEAIRDYLNTYCCQGVIIIILCFVWN